jgi:hypothetical protein
LDGIALSISKDIELGQALERWTTIDKKTFSARQPKKNRGRAPFDGADGVSKNQGGIILEDFFRSRSD